MYIENKGTEFAFLARQYLGKSMGQFLSLLSLPDYMHSQAWVTKEQGHLAVYFDKIFKGLSLYMCTRLTDAVTL